MDGFNAQKIVTFLTLNVGKLGNQIVQIKQKKKKENKLILKLFNFQGSKFWTAEILKFRKLENSNTYKVENSEIRRL